MVKPSLIIVKVLASGEKLHKYWAYKVLVKCQVYCRNNLAWMNCFLYAQLLIWLKLLSKIV